MRRYFTKETIPDETEITGSIRQWGYPMESKSDLSHLLEKIGDAEIVMLGESSHGTHEYYTWRTYLTQRLIDEKGFNFVAVEGDWPDCYRINRFVKGYDGGSAFDVLHAFRRWPTWMWANWEMVVMTTWLEKYNRNLEREQKIGFYGLDVYSLWESMESIMEYLQKTDPGALRIAREAFQCFEPFRQSEGTDYAEAAHLVPELCEQEVIQLLKTVRQEMPHYDTDYENVFNVEQNALIAVNAEKYYRSMVEGGPHSWNVRDRHMADTLNRLIQFHGAHSKVIVWAHNTHIGDARATDMVNEGMYNLGELARIQHQDKRVVLVGFGTYQGDVMAGRSWGADMEVMKMPEAKKGSLEYFLHRAGPADRLLWLPDFMDQDALMENHLDHRAIGVVYNPRYEQYSNYIPTLLPLRYDAFIYLNKTRALHPLHLKPDGTQIPETYPFGV